MRCLSVRIGARHMGQFLDWWSHFSQHVVQKRCPQPAGHAFAGSCGPRHTGHSGTSGTAMTWHTVLAQTRPARMTMPRATACSRVAAAVFVHSRARFIALAAGR